MYYAHIKRISLLVEAAKVAAIHHEYRRQFEILTIIGRLATAEHVTNDEIEAIAEGLDPETGLALHVALMAAIA